MAENNDVVHQFTHDQIKILVVLERLGGSLSLTGVVLIFIAYGLFSRLRTIPNTFIVFASIANAGASIASVIAYDGVIQGQTTPLCQAQGFLFHMYEDATNNLEESEEKRTRIW